MSGPITTIRKLLGLWPRTAHEFFERHEEYAREGQHEAAIDELNEALRLSAMRGGGEPIDSEGFQYLVARSEEYTYVGLHEKALADLKEADRKYGDDFGSLDEQRAYCLVELEEYQNALTLIEKCAREYNLDADLKLARARCLAGLARGNEAHAAFDGAVAEAEEECGEADPLAYFYRGNFLLEAGEAEPAANDLTRSLDGWGDDIGDEGPATRAQMIEACRLKAEAHRVLNDTAAANAAIEKAEQWEADARDIRPKLIEQIQKDIRIGAGVEIAGPMIGVSIILWFLGPVAYRFLGDVVALPPLPGWWQAVPASLLVISVLSLIALVIAGRNNARPRGDGFQQRVHDYR